MCVCVCVCERERETERQRDRDRNRERKERGVDWLMERESRGEERGPLAFFLMRLVRNDFQDKA